MITPEQRREIKRLATRFANSQIALAFNPNEKGCRLSASEDIAAFEQYLSKLSTVKEPK
jgi:hypothetical protein